MSKFETGTLIPLNDKLRELLVILHLTPTDIATHLYSDDSGLYWVEKAQLQHDALPSFKILTYTTYENLPLHRVNY